MEVFTRDISACEEDISQGEGSCSHSLHVLNVLNVLNVDVVDVVEVWSSWNVIFVQQF